MSVPARIFLLSPANLSGVRGSRILEGTCGAGFMYRLLRDETVPLGDVYEFISSLYYRGKRRYAWTFGRAAPAHAKALTITSNRGLVPDDAPVTLEELRGFASQAIDPSDPGYRVALLETAGALSAELSRGGRAVLLGSIATDKYLEPLLDVLGDRLLVPAAFVGRGDMSRGSLMLKAAASGDELAYVTAGEVLRDAGRI